VKRRRRAPTVPRVMTASASSYPVKSNTPSLEGLTGDSVGKPSREPWLKFWAKVHEASLDSMLSIIWLKAGTACIVAVSPNSLMASTDIASPNTIEPLKKPRIEQSQIPTYLDVSEITLPS